MPRIIVFDVNETLLDLKALDPPFERVFGSAGVRRDWFKQVLQSALLTTILDACSDFGAVGAAALEMMAAVHDVRLTDDDRKAILGTMRELPPHPEVAESLGRLREAGLRIAALTNSTRAVAEAQLEHAGLTSQFERILSADAVRRLKPHAEVYRMAARECGVEPGEIRLVAAHSWDVAGALRAGCAAAFVARAGMTLDPLFEPPDVVAPDLAAVAERILAIEPPQSGWRYCTAGQLLGPLNWLSSPTEAHVDKSFDLVVVGTGAAANAVGSRCRAAGWSVAIIDELRFGGTAAAIRRRCYGALRKWWMRRA